MDRRGSAMLTQRQLSAIPSTNSDATPSPREIQAELAHLLCEGVARTAEVNSARSAGGAHAGSASPATTNPGYNLSSRRPAVSRHEVADLGR